MASYPKLEALCIFLLFLSFALPSTAEQRQRQCESKYKGRCHNKAQALNLKIIATVSILVASMLGVCLPLFTRTVPAFHPDKDLFLVVKAFASGVILATGYMHVLPDSFDDLKSPCLNENPWKKFPFTTFVAMLSALMTLMVDSFAMSYCTKHTSKVDINERGVLSNTVEDGHGKFSKNVDEMDEKSSELLRNRVVAQVLEMGIVVHSVVIGVAMGASNNPCTIRPLIAALCFHQLFEGMGVGGCLLQVSHLS